MSFDVRHSPFEVRSSAFGVESFGYGGHGESAADVLLGAVNPSGKLAETVPVRLEDAPSYLDFPGEHGHVRYGEGIHVGYRWYDARAIEVDYPFGHGLSYTTFAYRDLAVTVHALEDPVAVTVSLTLANTGGRDGEDEFDCDQRQQIGEKRHGRALKCKKRFLTSAGCWPPLGDQRTFSHSSSTAIK